MRLPGGKELWIFSDTFLGHVNPDGSRPPVRVGGRHDRLPQQHLRRREGRQAVHHLRRHVREPQGRDAAHATRTHWYWGR
ncbi:hypothetical protein [Nonomuraea dietziae]|uniref:hypothetical protein n=1 Tax=Nonomuraea dietziae TaxID=65515 RepID=UPI0031DA4256